MQAKRRISIKRFKFSLESLLRIRGHEEKMAMADLARVLEKANAFEEKKKRAAENYRHEVEDFSRRQREDFHLDLFQMYDRYLERLEAEQHQAGQELEAMRPALEAEQEKVREARRRKRALEILKERRKEDYDKQLRKLERKELEEINSRSFEYSIFKEEARAVSQKRAFEDQEKTEEVSDDLRAREERERQEYYRQMGMPVDDRDPSMEDVDSGY
ncbi:MAG: flagellar FliJ family protein [Leptospiraceae bacterium]|nr:flagellar FliJ family protein [Leptospiraceae bacterium]